MVPVDLLNKLVHVVHEEPDHLLVFLPLPATFFHSQHLLLILRILFPIYYSSLEVADYIPPEQTFY